MEWKYTSYKHDTERYSTMLHLMFHTHMRSADLGQLQISDHEITMYCQSRLVHLEVKFLAKDREIMLFTRVQIAAFRAIDDLMLLKLWLTYNSTIRVAIKSM